MATKKVEPVAPTLPTLAFKKLHGGATLPTYATPGSACFDLFAVLPEGDGVVVKEGLPRIFRTGLAVEIPEGHVMHIYSRSGHGFKNDTRLSNVVGVIDADYRGEVMVKLARDPSRTEELVVYHGDRIAQAEIMPVQRYQFVFADELSETERGEGGFGSTGA